MDKKIAIVSGASRGIGRAIAEKPSEPADLAQGQPGGLAHLHHRGAER